MALKTLLLRSRLEKAKSDLENLRAKDAGFKKREEEIEAAIEEMTADTPEEDRQAVEQQAEDLEKEKTANEEEKGKLEEEIKKIEGEMAEEEKRAKASIHHPEKKERSETNTMVSRKKFFGMSIQERDEFLGREDVKGFLQRTRELGKQQRAITGSELLIPSVVLELIRENIQNYSKLYKHVSVRPVPGKARQTIMGTIPEGVWMEMCAVLNELNLSFSAVEVDGYKVGGFIAICNAILEDSDINLASEIITALGQAIGLALDKAILYGTGTKMPMGIVTRLEQAAKPSNYPSNARAWEDLHSKNVLTITDKTDVALFKELVKASGAAKSNYSVGNKFWAMNETTHTTLVSNALTINAAGAIVSGMNGTMPIVGGAIEELNFIPDDVIIGGYGDLYLLVERAGASISQSEHVRFLEDQTVFKGTARYDGQPIIAEGFVAIGIGGATPTAGAVTFAPDIANTPPTGDEG